MRENNPQSAGKTGVMEGMKESFDTGIWIFRQGRRLYGASRSKRIERRR
jgi:hypothetical protein